MKIEFNEKEHLYTVNGIITPSVTQLISEIWMPDMYKGIPSYILRNKAAYGSKVHELIEYWNTFEDVPEGYEKRSYEGISLRRYQKLQEQHDIKAISQEVPVAYIRNEIPVYAGKYDMVAEVDGEKAIVDIKTTAQYHRQYLSYQLTLYKMAYEQTTGDKLDKAYCMWLPKKALGNLIPVDLIDEEKLLKDIEDHENNKSPDREEEH